MTKTNKEKKNKGRFLGPILFVLVSGGMGFALGFLSGGVLEKFFERYISAPTWYMEIFNHIKLLFIFIIGYLFHIIIHEGGHLIFGLLSGYSFVSFRVGSLTLIREDGKFKLKRFVID